MLARSVQGNIRLPREIHRNSARLWSASGRAVPTDSVQILPSKIVQVCVASVLIPPLGLEALDITWRKKDWFACRGGSKLGLWGRGGVSHLGRCLLGQRCALTRLEKEGRIGVFAGLRDRGSGGRGGGVGRGRVQGGWNSRHRIGSARLFSASCYVLIGSSNGLLARPKHARLSLIRSSGCCGASCYASCYV